MPDTNLSARQQLATLPPHLRKLRLLNLSTSLPWSAPKSLMLTPFAKGMWPGKLSMSLSRATSKN